jgi:hypothetical protein
MVHCIPITLTHTTPTRQYVPSPHKIIICKNPPPSCRPHKERHLWGSFNSPNAPPRKTPTWPFCQDIVERTRIESTILSKFPPYPIRSLTRRCVKSEEIEKLLDNINLSIIKITNKSDILYSGLTNTESMVAS